MKKSVLLSLVVLCASLSANGQEWRDRIESDQYLSEIMDAVVQLEGDENISALTDEARLSLIQRVSDSQGFVSRSGRTLSSAHDWTYVMGALLRRADADRQERGEEEIDEMAISVAWSWACDVFGWPFCVG